MIVNEHLQSPYYIKRTSERCTYEVSTLKNLKDARLGARMRKVR